MIVIIALSHHSPRCWNRYNADKAWEKLLRPEAMVEAESKFIEVAWQMLFAQAMIGSQKRGLHIGDRGMYPAQSAAVFIKDPIVMDIGSLECSAKRPEGITMDFASGTNDLLGDGMHGLCIQFGNPYFEEAGASLFGERHGCQRTSLICLSATLPIGFGCAKIGVIQFYDTGNDIIFISFSHCLNLRREQYHEMFFAYGMLGIV